MKRGRESNTQRERQREQYVESQRETIRAKVQLPLVRGERKVDKVKKIEKETLRETRVTCVQREKKSLQLSTQLNVTVRHCSCCLCWLVEKLYLCILMIHVCIERERKILFNSRLTPTLWHCRCCYYCAGWEKNFICVFQ